MLYPKLNEARTLIGLSGFWTFHLDDGNAFEAHWEQAPLPNPINTSQIRNFDLYNQCKTR